MIDTEKYAKCYHCLSLFPKILLESLVAKEYAGHQFCSVWCRDSYIRQMEEGDAGN